MKWRGRPGRNGRAGELPLVWLAVAVALAGLAAVSFFKERVGMALGREANTLLAADLSLASDHPLAPALAQEARRRGLTALETVAFPSMARPATRGGVDSRSLLAGIKAVAPGYPLRGRLRVAPAPYAADGPTRNLPEPGACWLDARLAAGLGVSVGDSVGVGQSWLRVTGILTFEGERGGDFIALAPRLLMRTEDLPGTGLLQEGSRAVHRLLLAGPAEAVAAYAAWLKPRLERGQTLETLADARPELRGVLDQAQRYLGLVAVLGVLLAAAAIRLALERHVRRQYDRYALMRCFGASRRRALFLHLRPLLAVGLLAGLAGGVLGWLAQAGLVGLLGDGLGLALPAATLRPLALSVLAGPLLVLAVGLPALVRLGRVPVGRVLRRDLEPPRGADLVAHGAGLALVLGLLMWQAGEPRLGAQVAAGTALALGLAALVLRGLLLPVPWLARRLPASRRPWLLGLGLALDGLGRRGWVTTLQVLALALGLLAMLLLGFTQDDLLSRWRGRVPAGAPDRFLINVQPEQVAQVRSFLAAGGVPEVRFYPMVRGRLERIAGRPVRAADYPGDRARRLAEREFNLSAFADLPPDNRVVAGHWWRGEGQGFSVESGLAATLGIRLGDALEFDVGGLPLRGPVISLREVDWNSFRVNFFVVAPPDALARLPASYITSFRLPPGGGPLLADLVAAFPNLTVIDVSQALAAVRDLLDRLAGAVRIVFLFSLAAGVLVLAAALHARRDERARAAAIWRVLGADGRTVRTALLLEHALTGLLAGAVAAAAATGLEGFLASRVFDLPAGADLRLWPAGLGGGLLLALLAGHFAGRRLAGGGLRRAMNLD